jgi:hypothetical protein
MDDKPKKSDVEARLRQTADAMSERFASLQDEVSSTGSDVRDWIVDNPVKSVGGMLAAGLAVGVLFGGTRRTRRRRHQKLIDNYLDALTREVEEAKAKGEEPEKALDKALRDRVPLVVYAGGDDTQEAGFLRTLFQEGFEVVFRTALSLAARDAIEAVLANANVEELIDEEMFD